MAAGSIAIPPQRPAFDESLDGRVDVHISGVAVEIKIRDVIEMAAHHPGTDGEVFRQVTAVGGQLRSLGRVEDVVFTGRVLAGRLSFASRVSGVVAELRLRLWRRSQYVDHSAAWDAESGSRGNGGEGQAHKDR